MKQTSTLAIAVFCLSLASCGGKKPQGPPNMGPPTVSVVTVEPRAVTLETELAGRTTGFETSDVRPQVNGIIRARLFTEGSIVHAGQVLYQIDPAPYRAQLDQAQGQLANALATVTSTRLKSERYADLVKITAVSRQDADDAKAAFAQALANVQQQKAAVETARINLGYTRVTAPISGRIGVSSFTPGALVANGQANALTTIQRLDPIYVDINQSAADLLKLKADVAGGAANPTGARVRLKLDNGADYPLDGRLQLTDVTVDQNTGAVKLRAVFPNPRGDLLPGMYVRAVVNEGVDNHAIMAPQQAVTRNEKGEPTALVVDASGKAEARVLQVAAPIGSEWRVISGLAAGDRLIVEGGQNAKPGSPVKIAPPRSPTQPGSTPAPSGAAAPARK